MNNYYAVNAINRCRIHCQHFSKYPEGRLMCPFSYSPPAFLTANAFDKAVITLLFCADISVAKFSCFFFVVNSNEMKVKSCE